MSVSTTEVQSVLLTPYQCAKLINSALAEMGVEKVLPPQMFYTYVKKGYITSTEGRVSPEDLQKWFEKYLAKNTK